MKALKVINRMSHQSMSANRQIYNSMIRKRAILVTALLVIVIMLLLLNISLGSSAISLEEIITIIFTGEGEGHNPMIVNRIRMPMALMAAAVGACLGIGGCEIQTILRNPIASPFTLGITNAASFGAALGLILDTNVLNVSAPLMVTTNAFAFALLASVLVYAFSLRQGAGKHTIILFGIALNFFFTALTMILQYIADDEDLQSLVFWNMGSLLKTNWMKFLLVFAVLLFCFAVFYKNAWKLTAMTLEDTKARSLGVDTHKIRRMVILLASLLTAFAVCFVGAIGFVGIIAPHIARRFVGEDQRFFLPLSALVGAVVVSFAFVISKVAIPGVIMPIGLITAIIGIPVFLAIIFSRMRVM
ncbi:ABC-type transporter, permease protein [Desulforapulum autotrophicum HRM2]|jgi:iron complex transport system permease protein|uniref:ABC-type transporter, permease protein n=1 Tax=Desulforapulum autotrophicum (strain ATCC 43914 / DSM 3382 / VKM B-1955 / HRM2) TaxID=177437 RepID=C0QEB0_DESAH|nr:iron ABC transporter permease [Desulforapulum autotrophicum]ACN13227.1 ABC-type transporter, permease protein [Desulforapulum autotrophicum HRM2]